jgi:hypothetical protein
MMQSWDDIRKNLRLDYILLFVVFFGLIRVALVVISDEDPKPAAEDVLLLSDVVAVNGDVFVWSEGARFPAEKGMALKAGDSLITGATGVVAIRLPDGSTARISESSAAEIKRTSPKNPSLSIRTGQIRMERTLWNWELTGPRGSITTGRTPVTDGEITSVGVVMRVGRRVSVAVYDGFATWKNDGKSVEIPAGKAAVLRGNETIPTTVDLPSAPEITSPVNGSTFTAGLLRAGVTMQWKNTHNAERFRIEIRRIDDSLSFPTRYEVTEKTDLLIRNLQKGTYTLRVLSSDDFGLESDWSKHNIINIAGRLFDISSEPTAQQRISFRSSRSGAVFIVGGRISGFSPDVHQVLVYELNGQWRLMNWEGDYGIPIENDGYFETAVAPGAKVAIAIARKDAANLPATISYGYFPPEKDKRFLLSGIYRLQ